MSLSENVALDMKTLQYKGFVDLGEFTPEYLKATPADHALTFMFQPFEGAWVQVFTHTTLELMIIIDLTILLYVAN